MKIKFLPFVLLLTLCWNISQAQVFVSSSATGANNGLTWADAYTDLQNALTTAEEGDMIWVAAGTYIPGSAPTSTFLIDKNIELYGGFAGTEASLDERGDPADHPAILSGDVNGDDIDDNFVSSRSDNLMTVMTITGDISNATLIDGFTIKSGHSDGSSNSQERGGGIFSNGTPVIRNCIFHQNFANYYGGGLYQWESEPTEIFTLESCLFYSNRAYIGSGASITLSSFDIKNCDFQNNTSPQGLVGGVEIEDANGTIKDCLFKENATKEVGGLGIRHFPGIELSEVEILDCTFEGNIAAGNGGGAIAIASGGSNTNYTIKGCTFNGNSANKEGGGISARLNSYSENAYVLIDSCRFEQNLSTGHGAGMWMSLAGKNIEFEISRCDFLQNSTTTIGGALAPWGNGGATGNFLISDCTFEGNFAGSTAGAIEMGSGYYGGAEIDFTVSNCTFKENEAAKGGVAELWSFDDSQTDIVFENCELDGNAGTEKGGAFHISNSGDDFNVSINRTKIINNESPDGGAINISPTDGASGHVSIENSLIVNNTSDNAAISLDQKGNLTLMGGTIANNPSNGIEIGNESALTLQNIILYNPGFTEFTDKTSDNMVTSNGGNLISDSSMDALPLMPNDQTGNAPDFDTDYFPLENGNLVNAGVNTGVLSEYDLAMNPRIQQDIIDIGTYESPFTIVSTRELIAGEIQLSPNPATDFINIQLPEATTGAFEISLFDSYGRLIKQQPFVGGQPLSVDALSNGTYLLKLSDGERAFIGKFVKM